MEQMQDNEFNQVILYLDFLLDDVKECIPDLLSEPVVSKALKRKLGFFDLVKDQLNKYEVRPFKQFQSFPLKDLIVKLDGVRNKQMRDLVNDLK